LDVLSLVPTGRAPHIIALFGLDMSGGSGASCARRTIMLALDQDEPGYLSRDKIAAEAIERGITVRELPVAAY
jgi:hypothetical protein